MNILDGDVDVVKQFGVVFHGTACREEYHTFLIFVLLDECKQQHKPLITRTNHVPLVRNKLSKPRTPGGVDIWIILWHVFILGQNFKPVLVKIIDQTA